jgi:hypothetical protein
MSDEADDPGDFEFPPIWTEIRPDEPFEGPSGTASVMVNGTHRCSVPSGLVTLAWARELLQPGDALQVNFHALGRRGMAGVLQYQEPGAPEGSPELPTLEDESKWDEPDEWTRERQAAADELPDQAGPDTNPLVQLARSQERMCFALLRTNTALVGRVLRTADAAINTRGASEAHAEAIADLTAELAAAREQADDAQTMADASNAQASKLYADAMKLRAREDARSAVEEAVKEGGGPESGPMDQIVEMVIERLGPSLLDGLLPAAD